MSTHYLIDLYNDTIHDVVTAQGTPPTTPLVGNYVVRVDDGVPVRNPTNLADLLTKKYAGMLGTHGLYTQITYDDMLDPTSVDITPGSSNGIILGLKGMVGIYPTSPPSGVPVLRTVNHTITWGGPGVGPTQALLAYELLQYVDSDASSAVYQRSYQEVSPDVDVSVEVSFNSGSNWIHVHDSDFFSIPLAARGTSLCLRFTRTTGASSRGRVYIGSWAVLY